LHATDFPREERFDQWPAIQIGPEGYDRIRVRRTILRFRETADLPRAFPLMLPTQRTLLTKRQAVTSFITAVCRQLSQALAPS
jgi:hypothetical protein